MTQKFCKQCTMTWEYLLHRVTNKKSNAGWNRFSFIFNGCIDAYYVDWPALWITEHSNQDFTKLILLSMPNFNEFTVLNVLDCFSGCVTLAFQLVVVLCACMDVTVRRRARRFSTYMAPPSTVLHDYAAYGVIRRPLVVLHQSLATQRRTFSLTGTSGRWYADDGFATTN